MTGFTEIHSLIPTLPLAEQLSLRDTLDDSIDQYFSLDEEAEEQLAIMLMEKRLRDYENGIVKGVPWEVAREQIFGALPS